MSKKDFKGGLDTLLGEAGYKPKKKEPKVAKKSTKQGLPENEIRATFIVDEDSLEKLRAISYWDRLTIKEVVQGAISSYLESYEKKNGKIKPKPEDK
jgi:hypothetical protein